MAVSKCLVTFLEIILLAEVALAACSWDRYGSITDNEIQLGSSILEAGLPLFKVMIPDVCYGNTAGVKVTACDYDVTPQVTVISRTLAYVSRRGSLTHNGHVTAKVYCYNVPLLGTNANGENKYSLSVQALESRRQLQANNRVLRSVDQSQSAIDQRTQALIEARRSDQLINTRSAKIAQETQMSARQLKNPHVQQEIDARRSIKEADDARDLSGRRDLNNQLSEAELRQNQLQALQRPSFIDQIYDTRRQQQLFGYRKKRQILKSENKIITGREAGEQDVSGDIASRIGSEVQLTQVNEARQAAVAAREILAANARQAALAQTSLRTLNEVRRTAQAADAQQVNDIVRQVLEDNSRQAALAQASLKAIEKAISRTALTKDAFNQIETSGEAIEANKRMTLLAAQNTNRYSQADPRSKILLDISKTTADYSRQASLNQALREAMRETQRGTQLLPELTGQRADIYRRLRRTLQSSESSKTTDATHVSKTDKTRQSNTHKTLESNLRLADQKSDGQRSDDQKRTSRSLMASDNYLIAKNSLEDAVLSRQLTHNQRDALVEDSLRQTSLQDQVDGSRIAQYYNSPYKRISIPVVARQNSLNQDGYETINAHQLRLNLRQNALDQSRRQTLNDLRQNTNRGSILDHALFETVHEASRIAQEANARQLAEILQESLENSQIQRNALEQARLQSLDILKSVQSDDARQADVIRKVLAENERHVALNLARIQALQEASRTAQINSRGLIEAKAQDQSRSESLHGELQNNPLSASRDVANAIRKSLATNARQNALDQARQAVLDKGRQNSNEASREAITNDARQSLLDQVRRQAQNQALQYSQQNSDRQATEAYILEQARRQALNRVIESIQATGSRQDSDALQQARLAELQSDYISYY